MSKQQAMTCKRIGSHIQAIMSEPEGNIHFPEGDTRRGSSFRETQKTDGSTRERLISLQPEDQRTTRIYDGVS